MCCNKLVLQRYQQEQNSGEGERVLSKFRFTYYIENFLTLRPGADQFSKAAFGKSTFAKTCSNVLSFAKDMTGTHQSSKKQKYFRARFGTCNEQSAFC